MRTTAWAAQPQRRPWFSWRGLLRGLAIAVPILLLAGYFGIAAYASDKLTKPDRKVVVDTPAKYGLAYRDVQFNSATDQIPLKGWLIDTPGDKVIVMLHGRGGTRLTDDGLEKASLLAGHGYDVLTFDMRAHGQSGGERYGMGALETRDIAGALAYLKGQGYTKIGMYGVSMGASTALLAAPEHPEIAALMVDSPYPDLLALLDLQLPKESGLPAFFNPGFYFMAKTLYGMDFSAVKPAQALAQLGDRPIFQVHSRDEDVRVPLSQAMAVQQAGAGDPNFSSWLAPGKGHVKAFNNNKAEYTQRMLAFYDQYLK